MNIKTITESEARALIAAEADELPFITISDSGRQAVRAWLQDVARLPGTHNSDAWYDEAEQAANNAAQGEAIGIEMSGRMTRTGNPAVLWMEPAHFEWSVRA